MNIGIVIGSIIGALSFLIIAGLVGILVYRKRSKGNRNKQYEKTDINNVYGTYEVHYDPVVEVVTFCIQYVKKYFISRLKTKTWTMVSFTKERRHQRPLIVIQIMGTMIICHN